MLLKIISYNSKKTNNFPKYFLTMKLVFPLNLDNQSKLIILIDNFNFWCITFSEIFILELSISKLFT